MIKDDYITIEQEEVTEEERARANRAAQTHEAITANFKHLIFSYMDQFDEDEKYHLSIVLMSIGFGWFEHKGYKKELKNICLNCIIEYCLSAHDGNSLH